MSKGFKQLTLIDRMLIESLLTLKNSKVKIAEALKKNKSTISREINNNSINGIYNAKKAHHKAYVNRYNAKYEITKIRKDQRIENYVRKRLKDMSPEQIAGRMQLENKLGVVDFYVRKDGIYNWLYSAWGQRYCKYLKSQKPNRKRRKNIKKKKREMIPNKTSIHERPEEVNSMDTFGHWEADTLGSPKGSNHTGVGIVERKTKYILFEKAYKLKYSINVFKRLTTKYKLNNIMKTITWDNGVENKKYEILDILSYFCDIYSSWQKPIVEGTFGLMRKYIPKKSRLEDYSQNQIRAIVDKMNNTPRKCLGYYTPKECFERELKKLKISL